MIRSLRKLILETVEEHGSDVELPPDHKPGMKVPKGGSMCANCSAHDPDGNKCQNKYFQRWRASEGVEEPENIPEPADEYCCDFFSPKDD